MPLEKQTVTIPFAQGVDTKTAEMHVQHGKLLDLQNGRFDRAGSISKRRGYEPLTSATLSGATLAAESLHVFDKKAYMYGTDGTNEGYFAYDETGDGWVGAGSATTDTALHAVITRSDVPQGGFDSTVNSQINWADVAVNQGYALYTWIHRDTDTEIITHLVTVTDLSTGIAVILGEEVAVKVVGAKCRAIAFGDTLGVVVSDGSSEIDFHYVDVTTDASTLASVSLQTDLDDNAAADVFDVYPDTSQGLCAYMDTSNDMYVFKFTSAGVTATSAGVAVHANTRRCSVTINSGTVKVAIYNGSAVQGLGRALADLSEDYALTTIETVGSVNKVLAEGGGTKVYYEIPDATDFYKYEIRRATISNAGSVTGVESFTAGMKLVGRPVAIDGKDIVAVQNVADLQRSFYLLEANSSERPVVAQFLDGFGLSGTEDSGNAADAVTSSNVVVYANDFYMAAPIQTSSFQNLDVPVYGLASIKIDVTTEPARFGREFTLGGSNGAAGSRLKLMNFGAHVAPGFHESPEGIALAAGTSGSLALGAYSVVAIYTWYDALGNRYESAPSEAASITLTGSEDQITVTVPNYKNSLKGGVAIEVYRTEVNGAAYYLDVTGTNDPTSDDQALVVEVSDANLISNRTLYTTGGVLENRPVGYCSSPIVRRDRVFVVTERGDLAYSKKFTRGTGINFADEFRIFPDSKHGPIRGLAVQDGRVVAFAKNGIFYFDGDGPNNLGQGLFTGLRDVVSPVGMVENSPIVTTSVGTFFVSPRGVELLGRDLSTRYIGAPVENAYTGTLVDASAIPDESEVRFVSDTGDSLVYSYLFDQWGTWTGINGLASRVWRDTHTIMRPGGGLWRQSAEFTDNAQPYALLIDTAWIKLDGNQGWQKVFEVGLAGTYKSNHIFQVSVFTDYDESVSQVVTLSVTGDLNPQQLSFRPVVSKCQAMRFRIEDVSPGGSYESFVLSHLQLEIGVKGGIRRLGKAQRR